MALVDPPPLSTQENYSAPAEAHKGLSEPHGNNQKMQDIFIPPAFPFIFLFVV